MRVLSLMVALMLLAGCGQKGPLRLPDETTDSSPQTTPEQPAKEQEQAQ